MSAAEIIAAAVQLAGLKETPETAALLWELTQQEMLNYTNREELPPQLHLVGARILADVLKHGGGAMDSPVQAVSEGDTSMTFAAIPGGVAMWERYKAQLTPYRRFCRQ